MMSGPLNPKPLTAKREGINPKPQTHSSGELSLGPDELQLLGLGIPMPEYLPFGFVYLMFCHRHSYTCLFAPILKGLESSCLFGFISSMSSLRF